MLAAIGPRGDRARKLGRARRRAPRELGVEVVEGAARQRADAKGAPYDLILIDGAVEYIPDAIVDQLADGGRLGAALVDRGVTRLVVGRKAGGAFGYLSIGDAGVPALPGLQPPEGIHFLRRHCSVS